jgi:hypothetical protein
MGRLTGELPLHASLARWAGWLVRHRRHLTAEPLGRFDQLISASPLHRCRRGMSLKAAAAAWSMLVAVVVMMLMRAERARGIGGMMMRLANRRATRCDRSLHRPHNMPMPVVGVAVMPVLMLVSASVRIAPKAVARAVPTVVALTWAVLIRITTGMTVIASMAMRHRKSSSEHLGRNDHNRSKLSAAGEEQTHISTVANAITPGNVTPAPPCPETLS